MAGGHCLPQQVHFGLDEIDLGKIFLVRCVADGLTPRMYLGFDVFGVGGGGSHSLDLFKFIAKEASPPV